ncbi:MAG: hypothetical protein PHS56_04710 [Eubacteriales bacterium]|nr:hypothetical protein [Eubacteriales bacterium]MDD3073717.1 hypothetical protein [Eubacteriales bacterium]MDD4146628.1 hypothetical protein [Clostridia bacterium]
MTTKQKPVFDEKKLRKEKKFNGYYALVTSEWEKGDEEIVEIYRVLWRIEEALRSLRATLKPAQFTFLAMTIYRHIS